MRTSLANAARYLFASLLMATAPAHDANAGAQLLEFVGSELAGGGFEGLLRPSAIVTSPDGAFVYVAARDDKAVVALARDTITNKLSHVATYYDQTGGVGDLRDPITMVSSPDGANIYVGNYDGGSIALFARDAATGLLTYIGNSSVAGFFDLAALAITPNGEALYAASTKSESVVVYDRDATDGTLSFVQEVQDIRTENADTIVISPDSAFLYLTNFARPENALSVYSIEPFTGALTHLQTYISSLGAGNAVMTPGGEFLYLERGSVEAYQRSATTGLLTFVGIVSTESMPVVFTSDGEYGYRSERRTQENDAVFVFDIDLATGAYSEIARYENGTDGIRFLGAGPETITNNDSTLIVASYWQDSVLTFDIDPATRLLTFVDVVVDNQDGAGLSGSLLAASADGESIYAYSGSFGQLVVYSRDPDTGDLTFVESHVDGIDGMVGLGGGDVAVAPDGAHVYTSDPSQIATFLRAPGSGAVTLSTTVSASAPKQLLVTSDGAHVYAGLVSAIGSFSRDAGSGALTALGNAGAAELASVSSIAISPDDGHVYASGKLTSEFGDVPGIAAFARDGTTGVLTYTSHVEQVAPDLLAVSNDGASVYALSDGWPTGELAVYDRDGLTGELTPRQQVPRNDMRNPRALVVAAGDHSVYAITSPFPPNRVVAFKRVAASGEAAHIRSDSPATTGAFSPADAVGSPGGEHLYVSGTDAIVTFASQPPPCPAVPLLGCKQTLAARKSRIRVKDNATNDRKDIFSWKWKKGADTVLADFGALADGGALTLCLYDGAPPAALVPALAWSAIVPGSDTCATIQGGRDCWKESSSKLSYKDPELTPDGILSAKLKPGTAGRASLLFKGRRSFLEPAALPLTASVVIQAVNIETGECWEATFSSPTRNDVGLFAAASD